MALWIICPIFDTQVLHAKANIKKDYAMMIKVTEQQGYFVAEFVDLKRFTLANVEPIKSELVPLFSTTGTRLALNFQNIGFIDSSAIGCLISLAKTARCNGGSIKLCHLTQNVMEILELLHLPMILDIEPTVEDCFKS